MSKTTTQVLEEAKSLIENVGWCKHVWFQYRNEEVVGYCAIVALLGVPAANSDLIAQSIHYLKKVTGENITSFNDRHSTTKEDVIRAFDEAIKESKNESKKE